MQFPTYEFLLSQAQGMVTVDFSPYLNSGVITLDETNYESVLNVHCTAQFIQSIVEYVVACLLHNLNPLEAFRAQPNRGAAANSNNNGNNHNTNSNDITAVPVDEEEQAGARGDGVQADAAAVATTTATIIPHSLSLFRLPDEDMLVNTWPPRPNTGAASALDTTVAVEIGRASCRERV